MKKYIIIKADTNDGDYVTRKSLITDEQIDLIKPIIEEINKNIGNYETRDQGNSSEQLYGELENFELFHDFTPRAEYGIHTIESIEILEVANEYKLL